MTDLQTLIQSVDELTPAELNELHRYIEKRQQQIWWVISPDKLAEIDELMRPVQKEAAQMPEEEVNAAIDEAIAEVRCEGKQGQTQGSRLIVDALVQAGIKREDIILAYAGEVVPEVVGQQRGT